MKAVPIFLLLILAGCQGNRTEPVEVVEVVDHENSLPSELTMTSLLLAPNKAWVDKFGDGLDVSQTYTLRLVVEKIKLQQAEIKKLQDALAALDSDLHRRLLALESPKVDTP